MQVMSGIKTVVSKVYLFYLFSDDTIYLVRL